MFTAAIRALRVLDVKQVDDLTAKIYLDVPFSLFVAPKVGSGYLPGDVISVEGGLAYSQGSETKVPVVVGDWSPIIFDFISANQLDANDFDVYIGFIKID